MFALAALQIDPQQVVVPSLTTLDKTAIGAVLVVAIAMAVTITAQLIRVQNARVADQKSLNEKSERLTEKLISTFSQFSGAIESLKEAEASSQVANAALKASVDQMNNTLQMLLLSRSRSFTPPGGGVSKESIKKAMEQREREGK